MPIFGSTPSPFIIEARMSLQNRGVDTSAMSDEQVKEAHANGTGNVALTRGVNPAGSFNFSNILGSVIQTGAQQGLNPFDRASWGQIGHVATGAVLTEMGKISPAWAGYTGKLNGPTRATIEQDIAAGNWGGVAAAAVVGGMVPYLADSVVAYVSKKVGQTLGIIPPSPSDKDLNELTLDDLNPTMATRGKVPENGNIGHRGHMEVFLGPSDTPGAGRLRFEIPPASQSVLPIHNGAGGRTAPGAQAGISFKHVQNYASLMIPGSSPVYQSLGIQGHMIEFVGVFLGYNHNRPLSSSLHEAEKFKRDAAGKPVINPKTGKPEVQLSDHFNPQNPDPLYLNTFADKDQWSSIQKNAPALGTGGAWAISKAFEQHVEAGLPQFFEIYSGVARIRYKVIVLSLERFYERDDRVWYKFQALAVDGGETGDYASRVQAANRFALPGQTRSGTKSSPVGKGKVQARGNGQSAPNDKPTSGAKAASGEKPAGSSVFMSPNSQPTVNLESILGDATSRAYAGDRQGTLDQAIDGLVAARQETEANVNTGLFGGLFQNGSWHASYRQFFSLAQDAANRVNRLIIEANASLKTASGVREAMVKSRGATDEVVKAYSEELLGYQKKITEYNKLYTEHLTAIRTRFKQVKLPSDLKAF